MVLIFLLLLRSHDNLILKLHQKKSSYIDEEWLFISSLKAGIVPGIIIKKSKPYFYIYFVDDDLEKCSSDESHNGDDNDSN